MLPFLVKDCILIMFRSLSLAIVFGFLVQHAVRYWIFMDYHKTRTVIHHRPGPCRPLDGPDGGSEDLTVLDNGLAFISSGCFPWTRGRILIFNMSNPLPEMKEVSIVSSSLNQSALVFHGLSAWQDKLNGEITLMVINHGGPKTCVEVFTYREESQSLFHVDSITSPKLKMMNDLVMTSNKTFYITKYLTLPDHQSLELFLMLKYGEILYYDGSDFRSVAQGLHMPNGINISPDQRYLYVAESGRKQLKSFRIVDTELEHVEDLFLDTLVDNIEIDPVFGDLWTGCHPIYYQLRENEDIGSPSPSQILKVQTSSGKFTGAVEVYSDPGTEFKASSVATIYKGRMLAGSVTSHMILCDLVYTD